MDWYFRSERKNICSEWPNSFGILRAQFQISEDMLTLWLGVVPEAWRINWLVASNSENQLKTGLFDYFGSVLIFYLRLFIEI